MDTTATLYWVPVVPNEVVDVQDVATILFVFSFPGPTSRNLIMWDTDQWATEFMFQDVVFARRRCVCPGTIFKYKICTPRCSHPEALTFFFFFFERESSCHGCQHIACCQSFTLPLIKILKCLLAKRLWFQVSGLLNSIIIGVRAEHSKSQLSIGNPLGSGLGSSWFRMLAKSFDSQLSMENGLGSGLGSTWFRMLAKSPESQFSIRN